MYAVIVFAPFPGGFLRLPAPREERSLWLVQYFGIEKGLQGLVFKKPDDFVGEVLLAMLVGVFG